MITHFPTLWRVIAVTGGGRAKNLVRVAHFTPNKDPATKEKKYVDK